MTTITPSARHVPGAAIKDRIIHHPLVAFFMLAFAGTWLGAFPLLLARLGLLQADLPAEPFMMLGAMAGPALAALLVTAATDGIRGVRGFLRRYIQWHVGLRWYLLIIFGQLSMLTLAAAVVFGAQVLQIALQQWPLIVSVYLPFIVLGSILGPIWEEGGWRGFALPRLQQRFGPIKASLILGALLAFWHLPAYVGGWMQWTLLSFGGLLLGGMAVSIVMTWVYNNTRGSILIAILFHAANNAVLAYGAHLLPPVMAPWARVLLGAGGIPLIAFGVSAALILVATRGRLSYHPDRAA